MKILLKTLVQTFLSLTIIYIVGRCLFLSDSSGSKKEVLAYVLVGVVIFIAMGLENSRQEIEKQMNHKGD